MDAILHKANTRGHAAHGWLDSWHTFSFGQYYDATRMHFGALRVLNDDTVAPGAGFGQHPYHNMEIISIPLHGDLEHQDSMGNRQVIKQGDVQVMSAGKGITHSEKNKNGDSFVKFLQIWVMPNQQNVTPRYEQQTFAEADRHNQLQTIISPFGFPQGVHIHQNAWFSLSKLDKGFSLNYNLHDSSNGTYTFVLEGDVTINEFALNRRDGLGLLRADNMRITADTNAEILIMEVPLIGED